MDNKKCILGLDNDGVFTPITFPDNIVIEGEHFRRLGSIKRKIMPIIKLKILKGMKEEDFTEHKLLTMIRKFKHDYMGDFQVLLTVLDKYNCSTSIISKIGHNHGPVTIPDIVINYKQRFNQLILCPCNTLEIKMLRNPDMPRNKNRTGSMFYWYYTSLADIKKKKMTFGSDRRNGQMDLFIRGLEDLKLYFEGDDSITYEKAGQLVYDDETSSRYIEWSPDKGQAMEDHLEGDILYFVDDDISNIKIITEHFKGSGKTIILFLMTHFIKSDDPDKLHIYDTNNGKFVRRFDRKNPCLVQFYHIDNFLQLAEHMERGLSS